MNVYINSIIMNTNCNYIRYFVLLFYMQ